MKKITPLQIFALMICGRSFSFMTYFPFTNDSSLVLMIGLLISTVIQALLIFPVLIFHKHYLNDNICTLSMSKNRFVGIAVTILYLLFFMGVAFIVIGNFSYFMDYYFSNYIPRIMIVISCTLVAIYLGKMNITVIGKAGAIALTLFAIFTVIIVSSSIQNFHFSNFHLAVESVPKSLIGAIKTEFARNRDLVVFAFLLPDIKGKASRVAWWYFAVKVVVIEVILGFITIILGDFALITKLPFFSLAAYSHTQIVERYDAAFMSIWVIMAIVKLGTYFHCSARCIKLCIPKIPFVTSVIISGAIPTAAALYFLIPHKWESIAYYQGGGGAILLLYVIVPLILLLFVKKGGYHDEKA